MSRLRRIAQQERYFFITTNIASGVPPFSPLERTCLLKSLDQCRTRLHFKLFAYVVLPDHLHFVFEPQENELSAVLRVFKSRSALTINHLRHANGAIWQPRFFDTICRHAANFAEKTEYIHRNPVQAGFVKKPEDWAWSSAALNKILAPDFIDVPADRNTLLWPAPWR